MRKVVDSWSFPDSGAPVVIIPPAMVSAMGGNSLVVPAKLQITDAGGHALPVGEQSSLQLPGWTRGPG